MRPKELPPVPLLGMHRSGTSVATRLLGLAGGRLPAAAVPGRTSHPANERGFWEVQPLTELNERILRTLDGEWSAPPPLPDAWVDDPRLQRLRRQGVRLARLFLREPAVIWKDPRLCLVLPFWRDVIPAASPVVIAVRNPLEVVASLRRRDGLEEAMALALWEQYSRAAIETASGRPSLVVDFNDILERPVAIAKEARDWFVSVDLPLQSPAPDSELQNFVSPLLRHERLDESNFDRHPRVRPEQRLLHGILLGLRGPHTSLLPPTLPAPSSESQRLLQKRREQRSIRRRKRQSTPRRMAHTVRIATSVLSRSIRQHGG